MKTEEFTSKEIEKFLLEKIEYLGLGFSDLERDFISVFQVETNEFILEKRGRLLKFSNILDCLNYLKKQSKRLYSKTRKV